MADLYNLTDKDLKRKLEDELLECASIVEIFLNRGYKVDISFNPYPIYMTAVPPKFNSHFNFRVYAVKELE